MSAKLRLFVKAGNVLFGLRYLLISIWVLLGVQQEALTGSGYIWPTRVVATSALLLLLASVLLAVTLRRRRGGILGAICLSGLSVLEVHESFMLHATQGPLQLGDVSAYIFGPLLALWALVNLVFAKQQKSAAD